MAGVVAFVGGAIGAAVTAVGAIAVGLANLVGSLLGGVLDTVGNLVGGITDELGLTFKAAELPLDVQITHIIAPLTNAVDSIVAALVKPLKPFLEPIRQSLLAINETFKAVNIGVDQALAPMAQLRELVITVTSFKLLTDLLTGMGGMYTLSKGTIGDLMAEFRDNIFTLAQATAQLGVNIVDKVDTEVRLLGAVINEADERMKHTIETEIALLGTVITENDERMRTSLGVEIALLGTVITGNDERLRTTLGEDIALAKATVMGRVTPRLDTLGSTQLNVIRGISRLSRHIEDKPWFTAMLIRALR